MPDQCRPPKYYSVKVGGPVAEQVQASCNYQTEPGKPHPLGSTLDKKGVNFSLYAERATRVELLLFHNDTDPQPFQIIALDPLTNKFFNYWHVYVCDLPVGTHYGYRVTGPVHPDLHGRGDRHDPSKVLIDPYARGNSDALWNRSRATEKGFDNVACAMRSVVVDTENYDWEGKWGEDRPRNRSLTEVIIYEMHVRGFTQSPTSGVKHPGTFLGVIEKIPYLKELGVTAVELLPIFDFDEKNVLPNKNPNGQALTDYWGYNPFTFFAPQFSYCVDPVAGQHVIEFRDMVKELHKAGIEVILDVVFNHTDEGNGDGPTISFRGLANSTYYHLSREDKQYYYEHTGVGNMVNANHPITQKMIIEALEYWVNEMHVDGFRFDLASVLTRDQDGRPIPYPPVIWAVETSDALAQTKVIAEAWDTGLYQVGSFPGQRWGEWNGRYRDAIRKFVKGDKDYLEGQALIGRVAEVISGSANLFQDEDELPTNSINFITAHDGFTLNDLVSYNGKHNEANGWQNRDGADNNMSWNCGIEGPSTDPEVEKFRNRQIKNFAVILMVSQGVPMFVAGDEVRQTQYGNNNAYCQDNEITWFDWTLVEKHHEIFRFFKEMIAFRQQHHTLRRRQFFDGQKNIRGLPDISWHGCRLEPPNWNDPTGTALSFTLGGIPDTQGMNDTDIHVMLNMHWEELDFDLPNVPGRQWYYIVDTSLPSPDDILASGEVPGDNRRVNGLSYRVRPRSAVVLISRDELSQNGRSQAGNGRRHKETPQNGNGHTASQVSR
jgi:isoamylase